MPDLSPWPLDRFKQGIATMSDDDALQAVRALMDQGEKGSNLVHWLITYGRGPAYLALKASHPDAVQSFYESPMDLRLASAGGDPDIVRDLLANWDASLEEKEVTENLRAVITGQGNKGVHPRAPETLALWLERPETRAVQPMMEIRCS